MRQNTEVIPRSKLYHIATAIRHHWKMIARHVRDNETLEADFEAIILNHADPAKQALQMLLQWRERWPNVICTWESLHNALWDLNLDMIAKKCNQVYLTYKYEGSPLRQGRVKLLGVEEPAFIPVGTDVKARYRGALCDAKVKTIEKAVQCKVRFFSDIANEVLSDDCINGDLKVGAMVEARHPTENTWMDGWIVKVTDNSIYTVVYDDGDEKTLGRSSLHLHDKNKMQRRELPFLPVGTAVKVMYRGALCEAKVKTINKSMKCRISFFDIIADAVVTDDCIKGDLKEGAVVEVRHPTPDTWMDGMIMKLADDSTYTVVFNDGDEKTLKRSSLFL
ncbi:uncharacterized protein LOC110985897 isoform X2 [Acanthaster planci]|uniref:Uncharacterized protein LOC110985897 isoform X2 n=1 Tax=Acanthaster planci TaxID=133434 RepID=A0A8B7ZDW6_ACAPL|nr:uncharacterized protein LOC110985897 isoform X2 [Acanthaster planci]